MDSYGDFAYYYDDLMDDIDYSKWCDYIVKVLDVYGIKHNDILEMACGTGTMAVDLAVRGYDMTAFDFSEDMLSIASGKAVENGVNLRLLKQDMRDIKISDRFGIILCLCDSINYITDSDDVFKLFIWVYNHLNDAGIFIFDINSSYKLKSVIGNNTFTRDTEKLFYVWDNCITDDDTVEFYLTFFVKEGEVYRRFDELHVEKVYEVSELLHMLKESGFEDIDTKDGFTLKDAGPLSERISFICYKR